MSKNGELVVTPTQKHWTNILFNKSDSHNLKSKDLKAFIFQFFSIFYVIAFSHLEKQFITLPQNKLIYPQPPPPPHFGSALSFKITEVCEVLK